jgi:hypothetical protein
VGVWTLAAHVGEEIRGAETAKSKSIRTVAQAHEMAASIAVASDRVVAPRLTVLTVDEPVWRETVSAFAAKADAVIIDVSDASENLLWEVKEVDRLPGPRPVFIAERDQVDEARLASVLDGRDALVYTTGLVGRRRFERALFGELESTLPALGWSPAHLRTGLRISLGLACFGLSILVGIDMIAELG